MKTASLRTAYLAASVYTLCLYWHAPAFAQSLGDAVVTAGLPTLGDIGNHFTSGYNLPSVAPSASYTLPSPTYTLPPARPIAPVYLPQHSVAAPVAQNPMTLNPGLRNVVILQAPIQRPILQAPVRVYQMPVTTTFGTRR